MQKIWHVWPCLLGKPCLALICRSVQFILEYQINMGDVLWWYFRRFLKTEIEMKPNQTQMFIFFQVVESFAIIFANHSGFMFAEPSTWCYPGITRFLQLIFQHTKKDCNLQLIFLFSSFFFVLLTFSFQTWLIFSIEHKSTSSVANFADFTSGCGPENERRTKRPTSVNRKILFPRINKISFRISWSLQIISRKFIFL